MPGRGANNGVSGARILLEDIADVQVGAKLPKLGTASERGKHAVLLTVTKQPATSTLELTDKLEASLQEPAEESTGGRKGFHRHLPSKPFHRKFHRKRSEVVVGGGIFVVIVLFLFLANIHYHSHLAGDTAVVTDCLHPCPALYGLYDKYHEPGRYGYRHRFAGG